MSEAAATSAEKTDKGPSTSGATGTDTSKAALAQPDSESEAVMVNAPEKAGGKKAAQAKKDGAAPPGSPVEAKQPEKPAGGARSDVHEEGSYVGRALRAAGRFLWTDLDGNP